MRPNILICTMPDILPIDIIFFKRNDCNPQTINKPRFIRIGMYSSVIDYLANFYVLMIPTIINALTNCKCITR